MLASRRDSGVYDAGLETSSAFADSIGATVPSTFFINGNRVETSRALAEDLVHDVFAQIWADRAEWQVRDQLRARLKVRDFEFTSMTEAV